MNTFWDDYFSEYAFSIVTTGYNNTLERKKKQNTAVGYFLKIGLTELYANTAAVLVVFLFFLHLSRFISTYTYTVCFP